MTTKVCKRCGANYSTEDKRRKFCGLQCYHAHEREHPSKTVFLPGSKPWNKGVMGIHLSPGTEFKKGRSSEKRLPVGAVVVRIPHRSRGETPRAFVKIAEPNVWEMRSRVVWEKQHGQILDGLVIHHVDGNSLNDSIDNLVALTRAEHINIHRDTMEKAS